MNELLRLVEELQELSLGWLQAFPQSGTAPDGDGAQLSRLTDIYWDGYERTLGRIVNAPGLGYTRQSSEKLLGGLDAWLGLLRASWEYNVLLLEGWAKVPERFMGELVSLAEKDQRIESLQQLLYFWLEIGDRVFIELFRSDEYLQAQSGLVKQAMGYRLREREIVEDFLKLSHLPSRSEMDEIHRIVYELRREVRALRRSEAKGLDYPLDRPPSEATAGNN